MPGGLIVRVWDCFPKISKAMDGLREAHMGEASVDEAKLHAQPNDSNL
ncbi:hypothetical protein [Marinobacter alkaliphilus]|uniref:Uncharacterized protein n=1 Tax=Marinobacter alkaliphilus TaxID=254719 RepID=A0ABZ3E573_9GAMM